MWLASNGQGLTREEVVLREELTARRSGLQQTWTLIFAALGAAAAVAALLVALH